MINFFRNIFTKQFFGVSSWWGNTLGIKASFIRLFFIYAAFTNTLTILIYLSMIFLLKVRNHFKYRKRKSVFDL
jgi:phage shock protein PspC (stress-responsive transcriptional regulator)